MTLKQQSDEIFISLLHDFDCGRGPTAGCMEFELDVQLVAYMTWVFF